MVPKYQDIPTIAAGALISLSGASVVALCIYRATDASVDLEAPATLFQYVALVTTSLLLAPVIETALLAGCHKLLRSRLSNVASASLCVAAFSLGHAFLSPWRGLIVLIPAIVYIRPFVVLDCTRRAFMQSALTHFLHNAGAIGLVLLR